ncbi:cyclic lactone autoinducer peptide [Pseudobutyrivibrio sp.]|nr:cyclic lactone autoinducer peptide [Pseudobutyrivibrio sp.]MBR5648157.1 cyclic lactone autoinducer peptide [Pseudobutyrivibrio sp.]
MNMKKDVMVKILEKVARTTVNAAADSRCMWYAHQPKMPVDFKKLNK